MLSHSLSAKRLLLLLLILLLLFISIIIIIIIIIIYYCKTLIGYTKQVQRTEDSRA